jgi:hypothetical protein
VSHQPERKEKDCLNCGAIVAGRYCQVCGQENIVPRQNFWSLTKHFIYDIFHFDGKFFDTLGHLITRPGIITKEFVKGKRNKYLDPIRMYLFTSALFFLTFFAFKENDINKIFNEERNLSSQVDRIALLAELNIKAAGHPDSLLKKQISWVLDTSHNIRLDSIIPKTLPPDSVVQFKGRPYRIMLVPKSGIKETESEADFIRRKLQKNSKSKDNNIKEGEMPKNISVAEFIVGFLHKVPYLLFISLPFFAGLLKLLYRRRKNFFYSDHAVFTLHHYILSFMLLFLMLVLGRLEELLHWRVAGKNVFSPIRLGLFITWLIYLYLEMKNFYGQGWGKTFLKFLLLSFLAFFVFMILAVLMIAFSILQY